MKSLSIFVIEDDSDLNRLMQRSLQREGFRTDGALCGLDALKTLIKGEKCLLLLDYKLPDITAKELLQSLEEVNRQMPFVIVTGHGDEKIAVEMMKIGARDYVVKGADFIRVLPLIVKKVIRDLKREEKLAQAETDLREREADLTILHEIFSAMSQTIDIEPLLNIILETITNLKIFGILRKGGIFIVTDDRMDLVAYLGHEKKFLDLHKSLRVGDCLCGLAAETGKVIVSKNCDDDERHSITYPGMESHGHIIVPLKAKGKIIGVLYLYLPPGINIDERKLKLMHTIGNQIGLATDHAKLHKEIKMSALYDPLTGLANRRMMGIVFERSLNRAKRFNESFAIIMLDIDHFKEYNDTHGHAAGDQLLANLASLIKKETRQIDLVVRYGGEEFLVLLPESNLKNAYEVAERIRTSVDKNIQVTISLGIAVYNKTDITEEELIKKADSALYEAKRRGRNRVEVSRK